MPASQTERPSLDAHVERGLMATIELSRLHAGDEVTGRAKSRRRGAHRLLSFFARFRRHEASVDQFDGRAAAEAPWVAEMFSAFGGACLPFADPTPSRRGRRARETARDASHPDLHLI